MAQITSSTNNFQTTNVPVLQLQVGRYANLTPKEMDDLIAEVNQLVCKVLANSSLSSEERQDMGRINQIASGALQTCKATQLSQTWLGQRISWGLSNLTCSELSPAFCNEAVFSHIERPRIGHYGREHKEHEDHGTYRMAGPIATLRLHPAQIANIPESVRNAMGEESGKKVELFFSADYTSSMKEYINKYKFPHVFNLGMHSWAHPYYETGKDSTEMVSIGLYEPQGVYPIHSDDGVSFHHQKELAVIIHPKNGATALSPNNAHIGIDQDAPFSSYWIVAKHKDRILVAKQVLFNEHIKVDRMGLAWAAFKDASTVGEAFQKLKVNGPLMIQPLLDAARKYEANSPEADDFFHTLPDSFKNSVYHQTWADGWKNKEQATPHTDFGRAAFHGYADLDSQYRCLPAQKANILRNVASKFQKGYGDLLGGIDSLFVPPKVIIPPSKEQREKEQLLNPIVAAFKNEETEKGMELFHQLDHSHKEGIYHYVWRRSHCPRDFPGDFGAASFHGNLALDTKRHCDNRDRVKAVLCYLHSI